MNNRLQESYNLTKYSNNHNTTDSRFDITYNFTFISLISPRLLNNIRIDGLSMDQDSFFKKSTILVKQSYLIMTWLYYLTFTVKQKDENRVIEFAFLPIRRKMYTLTKAPMAHKTNSKEQIVFKFYKFKVSIKSNFLTEYSLKSIDQGLLSLLNAKSLFPVFDTNLLFLKNYNIQTLLTDKTFFNYYSFVKY